MGRISVKGVLIVTLACLKLFATPVVAGDFEDALAAKEAGDYEKALRLWEPLAEQGDAWAQHKLGYMYSNGEGVTQDYQTAISWYCNLLFGESRHWRSGLA